MTVIIADGTRHSKVGLAEQCVWNVKKILINLFPNKPHCSDLFQLIHRLALVELFLNERPTFGMGKTFFTPNIFQIATLKRAQTVHPELLSELIFPTNQVIAQSVSLLSTQSKQTLTMIASDL